MKKEDIVHHDNAAEAVLDAAEAAGINVERTRIVGMKWKRLGEDADPLFLDTVFLYTKAEQPYAIGYLKGIDTSTTVDGNSPPMTSRIKIYKFMVNGEEANDFTHYAVPTIPK